MDQQKQNKKQTEERRGAKGSGSVRQRLDGKWEARCTINGKRRSFYADKQSDALKAMRTAQKEKDDGEYFEPSNMTLGQWMDIWLEEYKKTAIKITTYRTYKYSLEKYIKPMLGKIKLQEISSIQLQKFYNHLSNEKKRASRTIRNYNVMIKGALDHAIKLRLLSSNPCSGCIMPKKEKKEMHPLEAKDVERLLETIKTVSEPYQAMIKFALFTGMRRGEIMGLTWEAVDFEKSTITVKQQLIYDHLDEINKFHLAPTKNNKTRVLLVAPFIMNLLKDVKQEQNKNWLKLGLGWNNQFNLVFTTNRGTPIYGRRLHKVFKEQVRKIGCMNVRFHDLRHTYAVIALQEGDSPKTVQEALGHATADFTLNVYAHVSEKMKNESAARMQAYFERLNA
ncbi:MAG: site-specific integrase [Clostridia bacterium]|nr:site-specific integrase [Clostridia bacterium]